MDTIVSQYPSIEFDELNLCYKDGVAYQRDMTQSVEYDNHYFEKYIRYENTDIANKLNAGRTRITEKYCKNIVDVGIGSGEFIKASNIMTHGYDINPAGIRWLRERGIYVDIYGSNLSKYDGFTFWDSLEHIPDPGALLSLISSGSYLFISIPIFDNLYKIKSSKHYRPNEHYYYFTAQGMIGYMDKSGFSAIEISDFETNAGRQEIMTFVFKKN